MAVFRGTASQLSFDAALASQGLSEKDFKVINLDFQRGGRGVGGQADRRLLGQLEPDGVAGQGAG